MLKVNYSSLLRYFVAVLVVTLTLLLKLLLARLIVQQSPFLLFFAAMVVSTWYGGLGPGLLATALAAFINDYFFLGPAYGVLDNISGENLELGLFVLEGALVNLLISALQPTKHRAEVSRLKVSRHQESLHQSEEGFRLLVENVKDYAIFILDPDGRVASWNIGAERILGYQEAEIVGQPYSRFFTPEAIQHGVPEQELRTVAAEGRSEQERWHVRKDGTWFWATEVAMALRDETGILRGFSKVMRDITERQQAESERAQLLVREQAARQEAEATNRAKDEFLSILSHELRTPLATILLWAELLRAGNLNSATTAQAVESIERNARSQSQMIEDLLDISRIITGNLRLNVELVELVPVIQSAVDTLRLAAEAKGIQLQIVLDAEVGQVLGDAHRLQQVVSNLLSNAIKFTPNGGLVSLRLARTDDEAWIVVRDTGQGISLEFLPYVFDRFRQANSTTTRSRGGLGLGLAIVRHLVELHSGTVHADSPGEGRGATFTVTLPLAAISRKTNDRADS